MLDVLKECKNSMSFYSSENPYFHEVSFCDWCKEIKYFLLVDVTCRFYMSYKVNIFQFLQVDSHRSYQEEWLHLFQVRKVTLCLLDIHFKSPHIK